MLSCEAALLYNVLAALGRYGEGRFGNGVLYDGSDPPVLQYNAAALIGLWLNVGQCIITALMQLSSTRAAAISASFFFQNSSSVFADAAAATSLVSSGVSSSKRHASSRSSSRIGSA